MCNINAISVFESAVTKILLDSLITANLLTRAERTNIKKFQFVHWAQGNRQLELGRLDISLQIRIPIRCR